MQNKTEPKSYNLVGSAACELDIKYVLYPFLSNGKWTTLLNI